MAEKHDEMGENERIFGLQTDAYKESPTVADFSMA